MEKLKQRISDTLEAELARIYEEKGIDSGDITPEMLQEWARITSEAANLFAKLIVWNK